jgi:hypothetical protein
MKKIPTLFLRDPNHRANVLPQINPGCEWALTDPTARATRKWDGTCVMLDDDGRWWARREVKADREAPPGWWEVDYDETTGKRIGWEPVEQSGFAKWHADALANGVSQPDDPGTYELVGPKVNGNPEGFNYHQLLWHAAAPTFPMLVWPTPPPVDEAFSALGDLLRAMAAKGCEGIVWHHPDGRMVKLKGRDFRA